MVTYGTFVPLATSSLAPPPEVKRRFFGTARHHRAQHYLGRYVFDSSRNLRTSVNRENGLGTFKAIGRLEACEAPLPGRSMLVKQVIALMMVGGEVCNSSTGTASTCNATPNDFKDLWKCQNDPSTAKRWSLVQRLSTLG